jgi:hypothetical protein
MPGRDKGFVFITVCRPALGPSNLAVQWLLGPVFQAVKKPGHEADRAPPASAEVKNA